MFQAKTIPDLYGELVPTYKSRVFERPFIARVSNWSNEYGALVYHINPERASRRVSSYVIESELDRCRDLIKHGGKKDFSLRFGVEKVGRGYHGKRGDFCMIGAAVENLRHLTMFYRSLEMIGGFGYDLCVIEHICHELKFKPQTVTFVAARANVFALKRNSNEKLYPKLLEIFNG